MPNNKIRKRRTQNRKTKKRHLKNKRKTKRRGTQRGGNDGAIKRPLNNYSSPERQTRPRIGSTTHKGQSPGTPLYSGFSPTTPAKVSNTMPGTPLYSGFSPMTPTPANSSNTMLDTPLYTGNSPMTPQSKQKLRIEIPKPQAVYNEARPGVIPLPVLGSQTSYKAQLTREDIINELEFNYPDTNWDNIINDSDILSAIQKEREGVFGITKKEALLIYTIATLKEKLARENVNEQLGVRRFVQEQSLIRRPPRNLQALANNSRYRPGYDPRSLNFDDNE